MMMINITWIRVFILCSVVFGISAYTRGAYAFTNKANCNGVVTWNHASSIEQDVCSIPSGGTVASALSSNWASWTSDTTSNLGSIIPYNAGCSSSIGDGHNRIEIVSQASLGSNINGVTLTIVSSCVFSHGTFVESDILMSDSLIYSPEDESFWNYSNTQQGPVAMAHELGHFIGLGHAENFDIMRAFTPLPISGGNTVQPFPDDANGARWLYGAGSSKANLFVSAQKDVANVIMATDPPGTIMNVCRGSSIGVTFTVGNPGSITATVGFRVAITSTPDTGGTDIMTASAFSPAGGSFTETHTLTVPNVPNGIYWIIWQDDTGNTFSETNENDNSVHSAMTISVSC
jgi:hypothetical protein